MIACGVLLMCGVAAVGITAMKKISPDTEWYPVYAITVCALAVIVIAGICAS